MSTHQLQSALKRALEVIVTVSDPDQIILFGSMSSERPDNARDIDTLRFEQLKEDPYLIYHEAAASGKVVYERA